MSELTFGEKAVGLSFNPGGNSAVLGCKQEFAMAIDRMNNLRNRSDDTEVKRMASIAITELQTAQRRAIAPALAPDDRRVSRRLAPDCFVATRQPARDSQPRPGHARGTRRATLFLAVCR